MGKSISRSEIVPCHGIQAQSQDRLYYHDEQSADSPTTDIIARLDGPGKAAATSFQRAQSAQAMHGSVEARSQDRNLCWLALQNEPDSVFCRRS